MFQALCRLKRKGRASFGTILLSVFALSSFVQAVCNSVVTPPGLAAGSNYYLAFLSNGETNATSAKILNYNNFVQAQATQCPQLAGITWKAIASTAQMSAIVNTGLQNDTPVYLLDGVTIVVTQSQVLWDTQNTALANPIIRDQFANINMSLNAWTGTTAGGQSQAQSPLGANPATDGSPPRTTSVWLSGGSAPNNGTLPLYAISQLMTVPITSSATDSPTLPDWAILFFGASLAIIACSLRQWRFLNQ